MSRHGHNYNTLRKYIEEFECDLTVINKNRNDFRDNTLKKTRKIIPLNDIITGKYNGTYKGKLKERLIQEGYKEERCEKCGLTEWLDNPIPLQLHHKDGNHDNNLLENLELLCPNCHSLTDTYAGKNVKHEKRIKPNDKTRIVKKGVSEDGTKLYDGYGNYTVLCPVCKENFMNKNASMCRECYDKSGLSLKFPKKNYIK